MKEVSCRNLLSWDPTLGETMEFGTSGISRVLKWAPRTSGCPDWHTLRSLSNTDPGIAVKGFCRCKESPKSVEQDGEIIQVVWANPISAIKQRAFSLVLKKKFRRCSPPCLEETKQSWRPRARNCQLRAERVPGQTALRIEGRKMWALWLQLQRDELQHSQWAHRRSLRVQVKTTAVDNTSVSAPLDPKQSIHSPDLQLWGIDLCYLTLLMCHLLHSSRKVIWLFSFHL